LNIIIQELISSNLNRINNNILHYSIMDYKENSIHGVFFIILLLCGNFVAQLLGCKTQKMLRENMYAKYIIAFIILFFSINLMKENESINPLETFQLSIYIFIMFIMFSRMNLNFTILVFSLLLLIYIVSITIKYLETTNPEHERLTDLYQIRNNLYNVVFSLIIIGFTLYFLKQRKDHKKNWSTLNFIFGKRVCDSMKQ